MKKQQITIPFEYLPSLREALLEGIEDTTADYTRKQDDNIADIDKLERELLRRCDSCYSSIREILAVMRSNGRTNLSIDELLKLSRVNREHLRKRAGFEGIILSQCTFDRGQEYGQLGRRYMGRCYGGMKFHCSQEIAREYVTETSGLLQIESP